MTPPRLLFVHASPRGLRSESLALAEALLAADAAGPAPHAVDRLDLFATPPAPFAADAVAAKMEVIGGAEVAPERRAAWAAALALAERVRAADTLLFTVPMWNGSVPWLLKLFIDTVTQPGVAFRFDPATGYRGLLGGRRAVAIYTSNVYRAGLPPAFGTDFQSTYFESWLRFCGIEDIATLRLQPTRPGPDLAARRARALAEATALGAALAGAGEAVAS
jgi:FMN-dependent NADH-azoreductase